MKKKILRIVGLALIAATTVTLQNSVQAQAKNATVKINKDILYQKITGFGGFVNSPQFAYNHMTEPEIRKMWGENSEAGYNIMRMYLPIGQSNWPQSLNTALLAKSLGVKLFASPWSMPAEWKTYNTTASQYTDGNGVKQPVYLKPEHYGDYANYLNAFVTYLKNNGVELDAISLQNEPDYQVDYAGCIWTPAQMATFIKDYGQLIDCKIIAPEGVGITDNYATAFLNPQVLPNFDIFGGHQYGVIQSGLLNVQAQGKEVWMTEFLINWNSGGTSRNFNWGIDGFTFADKLNEALLANVNAWVHYATKRYYGQMGDGEFGTTAGAITKRGNILSHYARFVTGATRVQTSWNDNTSELRGSSYISEDGNKVIVVVINPSANMYNLAVDLPFLSNQGESVTTTETQSMAEADIVFSQETNRPKVTVSASSVNTFVFTKSGELIPSQMTGELIHYEVIENQTVTNPAFGTNYRLSGNTVDLLQNLPLISTNTTAANGYLQLAGKFNRLVFRVESLSSTNTYTSANTTLYYINGSGSVSSHNYGTVTFDKKNNFDWILDISESVLTDGCTGIIGLRNGNYSSKLTFKFADVYFAVGNERGYEFNGVYSNIDGDLLDCLDEIAYTSLDFTEVTGITSETDWHSVASNKNSLFYVQGGEVASKRNVISGAICSRLELNDSGGDFFPPVGFTATTASYHCSLNGLKMLVLPFEAVIPNGVKAYNLEYSAPKVTGKVIVSGKIPANIPVLVRGVGSFTFEGAGVISSSGNLRTADNLDGRAVARNLLVGITGGVYIGIKVPFGSYYLGNSGGTDAFIRSTSASQPSIGSFDAYLAPGALATAASLELVLDETALPVNLGKFTVQPVEGAARLDWTTLMEAENSGFGVERSADGRLFREIGFVKGARNSETEQWYTFTDYSPIPGTGYYRLKQTDLDGTFNYSTIKSVQINGLSSSVRIYPNPVADILTVAGLRELPGGNLVISDALGRRAGMYNVGRTGMVEINISNLSPGVYFYSLDTSKGTFIKK